MPMDRSKYPDDWDDIALAIKDAAEWKCEKCSLQCRFPDEPFDTHKRTLTTAHINHVERDCRPENLVALCPACHLEYDGYRKALQRLAKKRIDRASRAANGLFRSKPCIEEVPAGSDGPKPEYVSADDGVRRAWLNQELNSIKGK